MAEHKVKVNIPKGLPLGNSDFVFDVYEDDEKLGSLRVSRGKPEWIKSRGRKGKKKGSKKSWRELSEFFERPLKRSRAKDKQSKLTIKLSPEQKQVYNISKTLATVVGSRPLPRTKVIKKLRKMICF